jgi:LysM repeat protein/Tfp pilus assembly protein PilO
MTKRPMKKKINLSKKEKNLMILLVLVVLFWIFYRFVFTKQFIKMDELKQEKSNYYNELQKIDSILEKDKAVVKEWTELNENIREIQSKYFSAIDQPQIMHMLNGIVDNNSLKVPSMYFNTPDYAMMGDIETKYLGISIPFEGSYGELGKFLSELRTSPKRLLVNQLAISKADDGNLTGQISLNAYSYGEILDSSAVSVYKTEVQKVIKEDPFSPYEGYVDKLEVGDSVISDEETNRRTILENFEGDDIYFISTSPDVTGKVSKFLSSKYGKYSLRTEFFLYTENKEERAYIVLDDKDILLKYPPSSIGLWAYSYGYSPVTLGFRFQDQEGNKIDLELSKGINWTGWEFIEAMPPQDIKLYPLKLDRIYLELASNRDDYGVILFDNIEAGYPLKNNSEQEQGKSYTFYLVQYGDTLESISEKVYGTKSKYREIMKVNGLDKNSKLEVGQILVIPN